MEKYEHLRAQEGQYPTTTTDALLRRAQVYALIAVAQQQQWANDKAGAIRQDNAHDSNYEA